jgi:hypothetical protein
MGTGIGAIMSGEQGINRRRLVEEDVPNDDDESVRRPRVDRDERDEYAEWRKERGKRGRKRKDKAGGRHRRRREIEEL